nr:Chain A, CLAVATA3/ESR (CLE)-related protein 10 [Arabidopsis thaliana]
RLVPSGPNPLHN